MTKVLLSLRRLAIVPVLAALATPAGAAQSAAAASHVYPGTTFKASGFRGGSVVIGVSLSRKHRLRAEVDVSKVRTRCGRASFGFEPGPVTDGAFSVGVRRQPDVENPNKLEVDKVEGRFAGNGRTVSGFVRVVLKKYSNGRFRTSCDSRKLRFKAPLKASEALTPWDGGHYVGSSPEGWPLSFDLVYDQTWSARIENLTFSYEADCLDAANLEFRRLRFAPSGISHKLDFEPYDGFLDPQFGFAPTVDGIDYSIFATIFGGWLTMGPSTAELEVGVWDFIPEGAGELYCNSVETTYTARRQ